MVRELALEDLGRPAVPRLARKLNEIHGYGRKLYLGYGNWVENTGPTDIIAYDPKSKTFQKELSAPEHAIVRYRELDGQLVIPGIDGMGQHGNLLVLDDEGWQVKQLGTRRVSHIFDIASLDGEWFAGVDGFVVSSPDRGETWRWARNVREDLPHQARVVCLATYQNKLYAFPVFMVRGSFRVVPDARGTREADVWDGESWTLQDILPAGYEQCVATAIFGGELVTYSYHLPASSALRFGVLQRFDGKRGEILASPFQGAVRDLETPDDHLLLLGKIDGSWRLGVTRDLMSWVLWNLPSKMTPLSAWMHDGHIYLGGDDGHLYRQLEAG